MATSKSFLRRLTVTAAVILSAVVLAAGAGFAGLGGIGSSVTGSISSITSSATSIVPSGVPLTGADLQGMLDRGEATLEGIVMGADPREYIKSAADIDKLTQSLDLSKLQGLGKEGFSAVTNSTEIGKIAMQELDNLSGQAAVDAIDWGRAALNNPQALLSHVDFGKLPAGASAFANDAAGLVNEFGADVVGAATDVTSSIGDIGFDDLGFELSGDFINDLIPAGDLLSLANFDQLQNLVGLDGVASLLDPAAALSNFGLDTLAGGLIPGADLLAPISGVPGGKCCIPGHTFLHVNTREHFTSHVEMFKNWVSDKFFDDNLLPALMKKTQQQDATRFKVSEGRSHISDARSFTRRVQAIRQEDYNAWRDAKPSEGLCTIGSSVQSLRASQTFSKMNTSLIADMATKRLMNNDRYVRRPSDDIDYRFAVYQREHCSSSENGGTMGPVCKSGANGGSRPGNDVNFIGLIDNAKTIDLGYESGEITPIATDISSMASLLYGNQVFPEFKDSWLSNNNVNRETGDNLYMAVRSNAAKYNLAVSAFAQEVGERAAGDPAARPYLEAIAQSMGMPQDEIDQYLGDRPSYRVQMEFLTKNIFQDPQFYVELGENEVNVEQKSAMLFAISNMLERKIYETAVFNELLLSSIVGAEIDKEQDVVNSKLQSAIKGVSSNN